MNILLALLIAYILYFIQDRVYNRIWNKNLDVDVSFSHKTGVEGDSSTLKEVITNGKVLPLPLLRVRFEIRKGLDFGDDSNISVSDKNYRSDIYTVMPCRKITRTIDFTCAKRGVYEIKNISLVSNDLLFSHSLVENKAVLSRLTVYPKEVDAKRLFTPFNRMMGTVLSKRFAYEDPFEFRGIRKYETFDSMRDINWKASARSGELMVNSHNYTASPQICILLDFDSDTQWKKYEVFEEQIRIAASMARLFTAGGVPVSLISNGVDFATKEELYIESGCSQGHIDLIKEGLARLDLECELAPFMPKLDALNNNNCQYLLISSAYGVKLQQKYADVCKNNGGSQWIVAYRVVDDVPVLSDFAGATCWEVSQ